MLLLGQSAREIQYEVKDPAFCFSVLRQPEDLAALSRDIAQRLDEVAQCKVSGRPQTPLACQC